MKMSKLFTTVFNEELKTRGFKKKGKLYYRLNGDILQGVVIKPINPYCIHFYAAPYWIENIQVELSPLYKGYWAESRGWSLSPGITSYYREENEQLNSDYMNMCFSLAKEHILPVLDKVNSLDSFIENCVPNWSTLDEMNARNDFIEINAKAIHEKYSYIDEQIKMFWRVWDNLYTYYAFLYYGYLNNNLKCGYDKLEQIASFLPFHTNGNRYAQNKYMEFMTDDGLLRAKQYFDQRCATMKQRLQTELGIDTSNL